MQIVIILPNSMASRSVLESPILHELAVQPDCKVVFLSKKSSDLERIGRANRRNFKWMDINRPINLKPTIRLTFNRICKSIFVRLFRILKSDYANLAFRFNQLNGFVGHRQKVKMPLARQKREALAGNFVIRSYGSPFPGSQSLFHAMYRLYYSKWQCTDASIDALFLTYRPDLIVFWHAQSQVVKPYALAARKYHVPAIAVLGSWDRPTTKGPLAPGIARYIVNNEKMKQELICFHNISAELIDNVGWPQMDVYKQRNVLKSKREIHQELGISVNCKLLLYAANSERLGKHEPGLVDYLAEKVVAKFYGEKVALVVRPHPRDGNWKNRFAPNHSSPEVIVQTAEDGRLDYLAGLLSAADILISTQGSVSLDAVAMDTCVINVAFDGHLQRHFSESVKRWYEMDHYAAVVETGGVWVVNNFQELDEAIKGYLADSTKDSSERKALRQQQLEPFDGKASKRVVGVFERVAKDSGPQPALQTVSSNSTHKNTGIVEIH